MWRSRSHSDDEHITGDEDIAAIWYEQKRQLTRMSAHKEGGANGRRKRRRTEVEVEEEEEEEEEVEA